MLLKLFTVRDSKAEIYGPIIQQKTMGEAERTFTALANDKSSSPGMYPEDYDLFYLGEFDDNSGKMKLLDSPQHVVKAIQLVRRDNSPGLN